MSFKCDHCGKSVVSGIPAKQIVVETRPRKYTAMGKDGIHVVTGHETVREVKVCPDVVFQDGKLSCPCDGKGECRYEHSRWKRGLPA